MGIIIELSKTITIIIQKEMVFIKTRMIKKTITLFRDQLIWLGGKI